MGTCGHALLYTRTRQRKKHTQSRSGAGAGKKKPNPVSFLRTDINLWYENYYLYIDYISSTIQYWL